MGWQFDLKHANTVAYVTIPGLVKPPRMGLRQLREFLGSIEGKYRERPPLWSEDYRWVEEITRIAHHAAESLNREHWGDDGDLLEPSVVIEALENLKRSMARFDMFGLAVGTYEDNRALSSFCEHGALSSGHHGLFLIPDLPEPGETLEMFDPLPVAREIASRPDLWPGVLFWSPRGICTFAALKDAYGLYQRALEHFNEGRNNIDHILRDHRERSSKSGNKRLLHLSDLHFGSSLAARNQGYLSAHLKTKLSSFHRVIVTGDLFDNPKLADALAFQNFRHELEAVTGKELIVVPGNHDRNIAGNTLFGFGGRLKELTKLEWSNLVIDDDLECVFYCFDSSRDAKVLARGIVSQEQMIEVAKVFEIRKIKKPELENYLAVALVHHHPYSFRSGIETPLQKGLALAGLNEESFLKMDDADKFLSWCAGRRVPLILHGHKHVPRHVRDRIEWTHGKQSESREVTAVGCGTSLGVEQFPLSYNVLEWSPSSKRWSASFFADPGIGTGFEETYVALHSPVS